MVAQCETFIHDMHRHAADKGFPFFAPRRMANRNAAEPQEGAS